ncbi:MAG: hypothetical protein ACTSWR_06420 [Candidatus Helarchaeota archaeon]
MKLVDIAKEAISLLQKAGTDGINNIELAKKLEIPRRRIYDIIAILKASNSIKTSREKNGTKIYWIGSTNLESKAKDENTSNNTIDIQYEKVKKLEKENFELKKKIEMLNKNLYKYSIESSSKLTNFPTKRIIIRSKSPSEKIKRVQSSKYQVFIEVDTPGLIVEPLG